jgi:ABC-2 type transport system permease protein
VTELAAASGLTVEVHPVADRAAAVALLSSGGADVALIDVEEIIWRGEEDARLAPVLRSALSQVAIVRRATTTGLSPAELSALLAPADPTVTVPEAEPNRAGEPQTMIAIFGMVLLFVALNLYGGFVLTGVVEEKSSRVVEVILARASPSQLLAGKVLGIGVLGISQFVGLGAVAAVTLRVVDPAGMPATTVPLIAGLVMWFVLGYALYSMLYGALGSLASRTEDAQAAIAPLTVLMLVAYFGAFAAIGSPRAWWVTAGSLIPPTAPMFMPIRSALTDVPAWQTVTAVGLVLVAIPLLARAGGRLYRGAALHTAGRLKLTQAWSRSG